MNEAIANHCIRVYDYMYERSIEGPEYRVYEGGPTSVFDELKISRAFYSTVWTILEEGAYISRIGNRGSTVLLHRAPVYDELLLTHTPKPASLPLVRRIEAIEAKMGDVDFVSVLVDLDRRLTVLESVRNTNSIKES